MRRKAARSANAFAYNNILLAQDPQSHHSIIEFLHSCLGDEEDWDR